DGVGELLPASRHAGYLRLPTETTLGAELTSHTGQLVGEPGEFADHRVDDQCPLAERALVHRAAGGDDAGRQIAGGDGSDHASDLGAGCEERVHRIVDRVS